MEPTDQKQMIKYLNGRVQNHMKEKMVLIEMNEELEKVIHSKDDEMKKMKAELKVSKGKVKILEEEFDIDYDDAVRIRDTNCRLEAQVSLYKTKWMETNGMLELMEKKKDISGKLIKSLQVENADVKQKLEAEIASKENHDAKIRDDQDQITNLLEEITKIQILNNEKEALLQTESNEKEIMEEKLKDLETENEILREKLETKEIEKEESKSLSEELNILDPRSQNVSMDCEKSEKDFQQISKVKNHRDDHEPSIQRIFDWKLKEMELEKNISVQKFKLVSDVIKLKKQEESDRKLCYCRSFCRIFHGKHNWRKLFSDKLVEKLRKCV